MNVGFIGLGLIGGSIAKALKIHRIADNIIAFDLDKLGLELAVQQNIVDVALDEVNEAYSACDIIFLCCPVEVNLQYIDRLADIVKPSCIVTDVGSTKSDIVHTVDGMNRELSFIGGHPMTGSEKTGFANADATLLENVYYVLTPGRTTSNDSIDRLSKIVKSLFSIPIVMNAKDHDYVTASISHMPHVLASALVNTVKKLDDEEAHMHMLAAGGFKDITRIASASPVMWQQICSLNRDRILAVLETFEDEIQQVKHSLSENNVDRIYDFFLEAKDYRNSFRNTAFGALPKFFRLTVDIQDRPGVIAIIATLLGEHNINIKNIGVVNNREESEGVMEILFEDMKSMLESQTLLIQHGYKVYS